MKLLLALLCVLSPATVSQGFAIEAGPSTVVTFPFHPIMNTTESFTVEWWMSASPSATGDVSPYLRYSPSAEHKQLKVTTDGRILFVYAGSPWGEQATAPGVFPLDDSWHHIAFVRHADGTYAIFVDGKSKLTGGPGPCWLTCAIINASTTTRLLEASPDATGWRFRQLRVSSIDRYHEAFAPEAEFESDADTVLLAPFDEGSGTFVADHGPAGQLGSLSGSYQWIPFPVCQPEQITFSVSAPFDHVGTSLAAGGAFVLAGVPDVDGPGFESGGASLFFRDGEDWTELPQLVASDGAPGALFGHSVAIDDDVALIGARGASSGAGAAYVFRRQTDGTWSEEAKLGAADATAGDWLGSRVAVEGDAAAVAAIHADAPGAQSGAVYVFRETGSGWSQEQKLVGLDTAAGDQFGKGLALSGGRILVGAYGDDHVGQDAGSAYVFRDDGDTWTQEAQLVASDAAANALFGNEVALDGDVAVVAARGANGVGAAYVFRRSGTTWTEEQKLTASTPFAGAEFGSAIAVAGNRVLISAKFDDSAAPDAGAAYLFEFDGGAWVETAKYMLAGAAQGDHFGSAVALETSGSYALVGAEWADDPELDTGELWAFPLPGTCAPQITMVAPTAAQLPAAVTANGFFLGQTQTVLVDGVPANLISATTFAVTYRPHPGVPGHVPLEATGSTGTAEGVQQLYPSLEASTTGIGGSVDVRLDNGEPGLYALAFATGTLPTAVPIASPPTWYGLVLDPFGPLFTLGTGAFATSAAVTLSFPVPSNPGLSGAALHFQAWCQQGFFGGGVTYSFTNVGSVSL